MYYSPSPAFSVQDFIDLYSPMGYSHTLIRKFYEQHHDSPYLADKILDSLLTSKNQSDQVSSSPSVFPKMPSCLKRLKTSTYIRRSKQDSERPQKPDREDLNPEKILRRSSKENIGFQNEQNLCTLNSILQILFPIKPFLQAILKFRTPTTGFVSKKTNASFTLISKLQELFADVLYGNRLELNTSEIASNIPYPNGELLKPGDQADVEEIFTLLKEAIEEGLLSSCLKDISVYQTLPPEISDFKNLFNGSSQDSTEIIFQNGNRNEKNSQPSELSVINLNVTQKGFLPVLRAALTSVTDDYKDKMGHLATMKKRTWILEPPKILTFRPQRAFFDPNEGVVRSDEEFDFPLEFYLDEFLAKNRKKVEGALKGIEDSLMENQKRLQTLQDSRNHLIQTYHNLEDEMQLINHTQGSNKDLRMVKENLTMLKGLVKDLETRITNLQKDNHILNAEMRKTLSEMKEVKYKLQGVVMHEGSADLGHYYALTYNHNTGGWTKFNDTKIRELSHEEGYNFVRGIVTQTEPKGKYAIESKPCAYLIFYVRENCELLDWNRASLEKLKTTIPSNIIQTVEICNQKFDKECHDFKERPYLIERVYADYLKKINELSTPKYNKTDPIPDIGNFKDFLQMDKSNCSELLNYITLKEIIQSIHIPYQILEGETENYYFKELERFITAKNSESPLKSLHLSPKNKDLLREKQKEFKTLRDCEIISEKILQCALESNFSGALITTVSLHQKLQKLEKTGYNVQFFEFANWIFRVLALKMTEIISNLVSSNHHDQDTKIQAKDLLEVLVDCLNQREMTQLRQAFFSEIKKILGQALNRLWSIYERDPIFHQMLSYVDKIGSQTAFLSQTQFKSLIPQVSISVESCVINHHIKDLDQNLMINEAISNDASSDSFLLYKPKLLQLYENFKEKLHDVIEIEKNSSLTENQYKSSQFHQTLNFNQNGQENLPPTNYQSTYSSSFPSHSKINNKPQPQEHFVNMNRSRK